MAPLRATGSLLALVVLVLLCLLSVGRSVVNQPRFTPPREMPDLRRYEERFAALRKALPRRGAVGYFDDEPNPQYAWGDYFATQYVLAPLVVLRSPEAHLVVGNFVVAGEAPGRSWPVGLVPVQDFGNGVILFEMKR